MSVVTWIRNGSFLLGAALTVLLTHQIILSFSLWHATLLIIPSVVLVWLPEPLRWLSLALAAIAELYSGLPLGLVFSVVVVAWIAARLLPASPDPSLRFASTILIVVAIQMGILLTYSALGATHLSAADIPRLLVSLVGAWILQSAVCVALLVAWAELFAPPATDSRVSLEGYKLQLTRS